jgi:predicted DNA-binding ribbon-helix-helix protein
MDEQAQAARVLAAPVVKRSISISGHSTSVSLEQPFWEGLKEMAAARGLALAVLVREIDAARAQGRGQGSGQGSGQESGQAGGQSGGPGPQDAASANLSSALRLAVLAHYRDRDPA